MLGNYYGLWKAPTGSLYSNCSDLTAKRFIRHPCILHAVGCVLMGACLVKAFPGKQNLAVWSIFFAFLLPTVSNLTYMIHTDNSRISVLLFWASVMSFQRWTEQSQSWPGLLPGIIWYLLASLAYENTTLLIFSVPLFVWPIYVRNKRLPDYLFLFRLLTAVAIAFAGFIIFRFTLLSGGAVAQNNIIPSISFNLLLYLYFRNYLLQPFISLSTDKLSWVWGGVIGLLAGALALRVQQADRHFAKYSESNWTQTGWYVAAVGCRGNYSRSRSLSAGRLHGGCRLSQSKPNLFGRFFRSGNSRGSDCHYVEKSQSYFGLRKLWRSLEPC